MSDKTWTGKGDRKRPDQTSKEESDLRWAYFRGELNISEAEMKRRIAEIRRETGKP